MGKSTALAHKPPISLWKPRKEDIYVEPDGKLFVCNFDKVINNPGARAFSRFMINKTSYEKQLEQIARYTNYFITHYDFENELLMAYLRIKYQIDKEKMFAVPENCTDEERLQIIEGFIKFIYDEIFSEENHIRDNINKMVDDNYLDDIEKNSGRKKNNEKEYLESLEFTNQHVKIMLRISLAMKLISPIMFHYFYINLIKLEKGSDLIYRFYKPLFSIFGDKINMFNKLFVYVKSRVLEFNSINGVIFEKRNIFGIDKFVVINNFIKIVLISENMVKYSFPEIWDEKLCKYKENIVGFNKTIIKYQLNFFIKEVYEKNLTEVTNIKNAEGLSGADKMEMNIRKMDEGKAILAKLNAEMTPNQIYNLLDIPVSNAEIDYMKDRWKPCDLQIRLIYSFYANYFGNFRDTNLVNRDNFYKLALLLKKKLLIESGWEIGEQEVVDYAVLPYVLTGNLEGKMNSRIIRNNKYMSKLDDDIHYMQLCNNEYSMLLEIHPDEIKSIISVLVSNRFTYVTPEEPETTGTDIYYGEDKIGSETVFFMFNQ